MDNLAKGKEGEVAGELATPASHGPITEDGSADVMFETTVSSLSPTEPTASSGAPEDVATTESTQVPAVPKATTELPSETVDGPAPTAQLVNSLVLVVSISTLFSTARLITRKSCAREYTLPFSIAPRIV